jgi:hypothetical protein
MESIMDTLTDKMLNIYCTNTKEAPFVKTAHGALLYALAGAAPVLLGLFGDYISYGLKRWIGDPNRWEAERVANSLEGLPEPYKRAARSFAAAGINPLQALGSAGINIFDPEASVLQSQIAKAQSQAALENTRMNSALAKLQLVRQLTPQRTDPFSEFMTLMEKFV